MARITDIKDLLFPVELQPVYTDVKHGEKVTKIAIPNSQVVINLDNGEPLGMVSKNYRIVTNEEAIEMGKQCCKELLGIQNVSELKIFNAFAPSTKSYCHIDLVHHGFAMNLFDNTTKPETYLPYVRITNSYNTTRSLRFDVGFCRKLCLNGVIFESETVQFMFSHVKHELNQTIKFDIKKDQLNTLKDNFVKTVTELKKTPLSFAEARYIILYILGIHSSEEETFKNDKDRAEYEVLSGHIDSCLKRYFEEMDANAYALFNTITDIASNPPQNRFVRRDTNSMQRSAGTWLNSFKAYLSTKPFDSHEYITSLIANKMVEKAALAKNPY